MNAKTVYVVENGHTGEAITANVSEADAREAGEIVAAFTPDGLFILVPHTLH